jgi:L-iditol 2-dehydrogenase
MQTTMRAAVLTEHGDLEVREVARPAAGPDDLLVRVGACGLCGSDLFKLRNGSVPPGTVLGHEVVGVVERCPTAFMGAFPRGTRVTVSNHVPCGSCDLCARGKISMCRLFQSSRFDPGGFAEWIRIPATHLPHAVMPIPRTLSDEEALFAEPLGCCLRGLERWGSRPGDRVLVIGLGPVGLLMVLLLKWMGAQPMGVDPVGERRAEAQGRGCVMTVPPEEVGDLPVAQGVVLTSCSEATLAMATARVEDGGWIGLFAGPRRDMPLSFSFQTLYRREVDLIPAYSTGPLHMAQALSLLEEGRIDVRGLISHRFPMEEIQRAVDLAESRGGLKAVLRF